MGIEGYLSGDSASERGPLTPIWVNKSYETEELALEWIQSTLPILKEYHKYRILEQFNNDAWYLGRYDTLAEYQVRQEDGSYRKIPRRLVPFVISHITRITDKRVSVLSSLKSGFKIKPSTLLEEKRIAARLQQPILKDIKKKNQADLLFDEAELSHIKYGEAYVGIEWNPRIGDRRKPTAEEIKKDKNLEKIGFVVEGDVEITHIDPTYVLAWPRDAWRRVPCVFRIKEILNVEEAKVKYKNPNIMPQKGGYCYDYTSDYIDALRDDDTVIWEFLYKPDEFMPEGCQIICTENLVLSIEYKNWKYSHNQFPFERYAAKDVPRSVYPVTLYSFIRPIQHHYNNLSGLIKKNIYTCAHPKWMMVKGACNIKSLGNAGTIVQHRAGMPPNLVVSKSVSPEVFGFRADIMKEMESLADLHEINSGQLPPNTRSSLMISKLQQIEKQSRGPSIDKRNEFMKRVLLKASAVATDYLPHTSEDNIARRVGKGNVIEIQALKNTIVMPEYEIEIVNSAGFSDDLPGRMEEVGFLNKEFPGMLSKAEVLHILNFRDPDKFYDIGTASLRKANQENESMLDGLEVEPPLPSDEQLVHWRAHYIQIQEWAFTQLPEKIRERFGEHIMMHEMLMEELKDKNQAFQAQLLQLKEYPSFYHISSPPPTPEGEASGAGGALPPQGVMPGPQQGPPKGAPQEAPEQLPI